MLLHQVRQLAEAQVAAARELDLDLLEELTDRRQRLGERLDRIPRERPCLELLERIQEIDEELRSVLQRRIRQEERALYELSRPIVGRTVSRFAHDVG